jgi:hypothetical protein
MLSVAVICASLLAAQAPPAEAPPPPAPEEATPGENAPPPLYDPVAEEASLERDRAIRRAVAWASGGVAGAGLAAGAASALALAGGAASWVHAADLEDAGKATAPFKPVGTALVAAGIAGTLLSLPALALGSAWFMASWVAGTARD